MITELTAPFRRRSAFCCAAAATAVAVGVGALLAVPPTTEQSAKPQVVVELVTGQSSIRLSASAAQAYRSAASRLRAAADSRDSAESTRLTAATETTLVDFPGVLDVTQDSSGAVTASFSGNAVDALASGLEAGHTISSIIDEFTPDTEATAPAKEAAEITELVFEAAAGVLSVVRLLCTDPATNNLTFTLGLGPGPFVIGCGSHVI